MSELRFWWNFFCDADNSEESCKYIKKIVQNHGICLFHLYNKSENQRLKALTIFQISYYSVNNSTMKTSLHDSIGQSVHEIDSSKQLIQIIYKIQSQTNYINKTNKLSKIEQG